jgi:hypothetical protein
MSLLFGCTKDGETTLPAYNKIIFLEDFNTSIDNTDFDILGWTNFAEIGTKIWREETFGGNGYAQFSSNGSGELANIAWLVSPSIDMDKQDNEKLTFQAAQNFLRSRENILEVLVSTNYNGNNLSAADWILVPAIIPVPETERFAFISSGQIDLSRFKGKLNVAFRVTGSGTNGNLTGTYQIDNVMIFYKVQE